MPAPITVGTARTVLGRAAFTPRLLPNLTLWLRADQGTYQDAALTTVATADTNPVGGWTDLSGLGRTFTQGTAGSRPLLKLNILGGRPVLRFDGVDDFIAATIPASAAATIWVVAQKRSAPAAGAQSLLSFGATTNTVETASGTSATNYLWSTNQAAGVSAIAGVAANANLLALRFNSAASLDTFANGGTATNLDPSDGYAAATTLNIGAAAAASQPGDFDVAEVVVVGRALLATELRQLNVYGSARYGVAIT